MKVRSSVSLPPIPDKLYFKIGEVGAIAGVATHVLRFWESQFPAIAPRRTASGQRLYTRKEVELVLAVKHLLYRRKFTIEGARQHLRARADEEKGSARQVLEEVREGLEQLRRLLD
jgi:DNA-binding transcriptional MerR regulator